MSHSADTMQNTSNHQVGSKSPHKWLFNPPKDTVEAINEEIIRDVQKAPPEDQDPLAWHPSHQGISQPDSSPVR